jgi:hypothetical protein
MNTLFSEMLDASHPANWLDSGQAYASAPPAKKEKAALSLSLLGGISVPEDLGKRASQKMELSIEQGSYVYIEWW